MLGEGSDGRASNKPAVRELQEAEDQSTESRARRGYKVKLTDDCQCNLARPGCSPCKKAGWDCPGYDTNLLFHHQHVADLAEKPEPGSQRARSDTSRSRTPLQLTLSSPTDRLRSELVHKGNSGQLSARFVVLPSVRIMEHLPSHLGEDRALDDAVQLICASQPEDSMRRYGIALRSLQRSIENGPSSEALGAATLLQMHDVLQVTSLNTWAVHAKGSINMHANGIINMLRARGPDAIKNGFDGCLLQAQVGNITFDALRKRIPCFLSLPRWNAKLKAFIQAGGPDGDKYCWEMSLIPIGVQFPTLLCRFEALQRGRKDFKLNANGISGRLDTTSLLSDLRSVRQELEHGLKLVPDDAIKSAPQASVANRMKPALLLASYVYLLMLDYMIDEIRRGDEYHMKTEDVGGPSIDPKYLTHILTLETTKRLHGRLREIDPIALQSTGDMLRFTMDRIVEVTDDLRFRTGPMAMVLEEVYDMLSPPAHMQREVSWSRDDSPRPTLGDWATVPPK